MGSAADMLGAVDFSGTDFDPGTPDTGDAATDPAPAAPDAGDTDADLGVPGEVDEPAGDETPADETPVEDEQPDAEEAPAEPPADPAAELPDGVREVTDAKGKKEMRLTPQRYETFHGAHKTLRQFEEMIGEPLTPEAFNVRNAAYMGQERLYTDLLSGEPELQSNVLNHFLDEAQRAVDEGEVGANPAISLGQAFYETLQKRSPDAYAHLRMRQATDLVSEMYSEAHRAGNPALARSASHVAKALGLKYKNETEISQYLATPRSADDPVATLQAENQRLKQQIDQGTAATRTEQFQSWQSKTKQEVTTGVLKEAIEPSLTSERKAWEKYPTQFENLVATPLNKAVRSTILADKNFVNRVTDLDKLAHRATSEQKRNEYAAQIKQLYVNRARLAVDAHKGPIMREAAALLKQGNDATHARRNTAQEQRRPTGPQSPAPRSVIPGRDVVNPGGVFDSKAEVARLARLVG
jgi:hypothetical protein